MILCLVFTWYVFPLFYFHLVHIFTLTMHILKTAYNCVTSKKVQSHVISLLIGVFSAFIFNMIIDIFESILLVFYLAQVLFVYSFGLFEYFFSLSSQSLSWLFCYTHLGYVLGISLGITICVLNLSWSTLTTYQTTYIRNL